MTQKLGAEPMLTDTAKVHDDQSPFMIRRYTLADFEEVGKLEESFPAVMTEMI